MRIQTLLHSRLGTLSSCRHCMYLSPSQLVSVSSFLVASSTSSTMQTRKTLTFVPIQNLRRLFWVSSFATSFSMSLCSGCLLCAQNSKSVFEVSLPLMCPEGLVPPRTSRFLSSHGSSNSSAAGRQRDELAQVIELIGRDEPDMESKLSHRNVDLFTTLMTEILQSLNHRHISSLRFFNWVLKTHSSFKPNSEIYNLIIDNLGRIEDYDSILLLLRELSSRKLCLTEKAFAFLSDIRSDLLRGVNTVKRVVETLNQVKGSSRSSGIYNLIKVLCASNSFDFAIFVMEETARKTSFYNLLIAAKCKHFNFSEAQELLDEMKYFGCDPNVKSYNYLLGSLCKKGRIVEGCELLEKMEILGYLPDAITFEVVAVHACRCGRLDFAIQLLYHMMAEGIKPRPTTHAVFIKGYFWTGRTKDAHKYVIDMGEKDKWSVNSNYSLLAKLFNASGKIEEAHDILVEMMEKGIKPNFTVYIRVMKGLYKLGMGDLASDLKCRFSSFP